MYVIAQFLFAFVVVICFSSLFWRMCYEEEMDDSD